VENQEIICAQNEADLELQMYIDTYLRLNGDE